jgi:hypothetical protein
MDMAEMTSRTVLKIRLCQDSNNSFFLKLRAEEDIVDHSLHLKMDEYCAKKWERVGSDEDVRSWLIGGWTYHEGLR